MPSPRIPRRASLIRYAGGIALALALISPTLSSARAAAQVAPFNGRTDARHLTPAKGPALLHTVALNAFPVRPDGFGDARFGVVEAFESPTNATALHVGWERVQVRWDLLQPRGPLQWDANATEHDLPFDREIEAGRQLVGVLQGVPSWAATKPSDGNAAVPLNLDRPWNDPSNYWGQFVFRAVRHYAGRIDTFVIMNEVNIATGAYHQFEGTVADYAQMLRVAYLAAHAANPHVEVHIYGDSVYADRGTWFSQTIDTLAGFPDAAANNYFFDAAEVHLYSSVLHWDALMAAWHQAMLKHGFDRPIWLSETNVSPRDDHDPGCKCLANPADHNALLADQPSFIVDSFASALGLGMPRAEIYRMLDPKKIWPEHPNGLIRRDGTRRPEYYAFKTVNTWFADVTRTRYQSCDTPYVDKSCVFRITMERPETSEHPTQEIVVLWNQGGKTANVAVDALAHTAMVVQPDGSTANATAASGKYLLSLPAATDTGVASNKMFDIGSTPLIIVQNLSQSQHVANLHTLFTERNRTHEASAALGAVQSIAYAPDGSGVHAIADTAHDRVLIDDAAGRSVQAIGGTGGEPGQFRGPSGVAIGADGTLYVADMGNARIQEFDLQGHLLGGFGGFGYTGDALRAPTAVAAAPDNSIYVIDAAQGAILHFTRFGKLLSRFGAPAYSKNTPEDPNGITGYGRGRFDGPGGIAVDAGGNIYVADTLNNRVVEFDSTGNVLNQFGSGDAGSGATSLHWPTAVTVLADGSVAIADSANGRIVIVSHPQTYVGAVDVSGVAAPGGLAIAADGSYFVSDTTADRIVHLDASGKVISSFGSRGFGKGQFDQPLGLALGPDGNLYVADHNNNRIEVVSPSGQGIAHIGSQGHGDGQFTGPRAVSVAPDGTVWVADDGNGRIQHLRPDGSVASPAIRGVNGAWGVVSDGQRGVYYSAHWGAHVFHQDKTGRTQGWGAPGSGAGEFNQPWALAISHDGAAVYALDAGNARVQMIVGGRIAGERGGANASSAGLQAPVAVAVAGDGSVAVLDAARHRIVRYLGAEAGGFSLLPQPAIPLGLATSGQNAITSALCGAWSGESATTQVPLQRDASASPQ